VLFCMMGQNGSFLLCLTDLFFYLCLWLAAVWDWRDRRIPNYCMVLIGGLALLRWMCDGGYSMSEMVVGACTAGVPFVILHMIKPEGLGRADVKLVISTGAYAGIGCVLVSVTVGVILAVIYCLYRLLIQMLERSMKEKITVPLGSCICVGAAVCYYQYFELHFELLYGMIN